jgi:hypothetical protein
MPLIAVGMRLRFVQVVLLLVLTGSFKVPMVQGATIEGVVFPDTHNAGNTTLPIRGLGLLRYMVFIKVYVAALYLPEEVPSESALSDTPKRLEINYFHAITGEDFARSTDEFIARNVPSEMMGRLRTQIDRLNRLYEDVNPGDRYALTYIPGRGTELALNGEGKGVIRSPDFAAAVFSIWLGKEPVDVSLKRQLLGDS